MYFTIKKDSFFTQDTRFSHCIEDNLFSQNFHSSAFRHDTSLGAHPGIVIKEGRRRGVPRGVSSRPTHNHPRPQLHMWLPTPFSSPPPQSTPSYCIPYCGQSSTVPGACVSHISSTSKSNIFHLLIPVWVFETEDRMAFARITQVRLVKFFIRKTEKTKCKLIKFLFEFKTRGECQPLTPWLPRSDC